MLHFVGKTAQFSGGAAHHKGSRLDRQELKHRAVWERGLVGALRQGLRMKENGGDGQYGECVDGVFHSRYERKRLIVVWKTRQM